MELAPQQNPFKPSKFLKIEPASQQVWVGEEPVYVNQEHFIFLDLLNRWREQEQPCPRELLYQAIYPDETEVIAVRDARLDGIVSRVRNKLKPYPQVWIETVWKVGYRLHVCPDQQADD